MAKRPPSKKARKRAAAQGALVRKTRAGVRGALAELSRRFPERGREVRAERAAERRAEAEKAARKAQKRAKQAEGRARGKTRKAKATPLVERLSRETEKRAREAEEVARREKARADKLEAEFRAAREKDLKEQAAKRERLRRARHAAREAAKAAGFPSHAPWEGPPAVDRGVLLDRFTGTDSAGLDPQNVRIEILKGGGWQVVAEFAETLDGVTEVHHLRGYEIRVRRHRSSPLKRGAVRRPLVEDEEMVEDSYVFWARRESLAKYTPKEMFEEDYTSGALRDVSEDFIMAWTDKANDDAPCARQRCRHVFEFHAYPGGRCSVPGCRCLSFVKRSS